MTTVYLSIQQVAERTNTHPRTVRRWITSGLPVAQPIPRGKLLIAESDLTNFLTAHRATLNELVDETVKELLSQKTAPPRAATRGGKERKGLDERNSIKTSVSAQETRAQEGPTVVDALARAARPVGSHDGSRVGPMPLH